MSSPAKQGSPGGGGLLQGSRTRSYGSLVKSLSSPARERRIEHCLEPGDTLAGLAVKYGVTVSLLGKVVLFKVLGGYSGWLRTRGIKLSSCAFSK